MTSPAKLLLICGAVVAALAVAAGAFGAHGLRASLDPAMLSVYRTAVDYHFYHALGLIVVALVADRLPQSRLVRSAGWLMLAGIVLFSGSLYGISLAGARLGMVTPFGGLAFIGAWVLLAIGVARGSPGR